ncbi:YaiI/YqxD family protein [Thiomicrospira sp. WB1]|uniref:YaiI/YqxD family protein n=1 Tax=Thiomicrospira sp. WB1 TaxID=1685380 RepID=UPI00074AFB12|nr:YaiI/YqxD family protein [Thiomicrospira sp. WB1]KUJ72318.1 hypothetical protein AVO41_00430 [Thiomicrospira sp. WB1]
MTVSTSTDHSATIWVDADACPAPMKQILFKAAKRTQIPVCLLANHPLSVPGSAYIDFIQVPQGIDAADHVIVQKVRASDLVITADIPLASEVIAKGALALNPRGQLYTEDNIAQRLRVRNELEQLRASGIQTGGPPPLSQKDKQAFARVLEQFLLKALREQGVPVRQSIRH